MKNFFKSIFRFRQWSDWDRNVGYVEFFRKIFSVLFGLEKYKEAKAKNFEAMVKKYNLTDEQLLQQSNTFLGLMALFGIFVIGIWCYIFYLLSQGQYLISMVVFCLSLIPLSLIFRYYLYRSLIQTRQLSIKFRAKKSKVK